MCAQHDRLGQQRSGLRVLGLHATPDGWYSQLRRASHGGTFITVTPAGQDVVTTQLRELSAETRRLAG